MMSGVFPMLKNPPKKSLGGEWSTSTSFNSDNSASMLILVITVLLRTFAPIVSAHPYCARLVQIYMPRHASSARAKY